MLSPERGSEKKEDACERTFKNRRGRLAEISVYRNLFFAVQLKMMIIM